MALIAFVVGMIAYAATPYHPPTVSHHARPGDTDQQLYRDIEARVAKGQDYRSAALVEHRAHGAPTRPAMAFREPALTRIVIGLGGETNARHAQVILAVAAAALTSWALSRAGFGLLASLSVAGLQLLTVAHVLAPGAAFSHETWAALLVVISLTSYRLGALPIALAAALAACLVRELALPYVLAMAACATLERRWRELLGWALIAGVFAALYVRHAALFAIPLLPTDRASPGWLWFGGWPFVVDATRSNPC